VICARRCLARRILEFDLRANLEAMARLPTAREDGEMAGSGGWSGAISPGGPLERRCGPGPRSELERGPSL
jgi:hypothetical protein